MLSVNGVNKYYNKLHVLKDISLEIQKGEVVSLVGPSGAGKSTLLHILGTLIRPDNGKVNLFNTNVWDLNTNNLAKFRNKNIGFVYQFHQLLPELNALENVSLPALIAKKSKSEAIQLSKELIAFFGLEHRMFHKPAELSGGEQQRFAMARALVNKPAIVLADEPSGNLDSQNANELHQLVFKLREQFNQTFVYVTHNEAFAKMADRTLRMADGIILQ